MIQTEPKDNWKIDKRLKHQNMANLAELSVSIWKTKIFLIFEHYNFKVLLVQTK